MVNDPSTVGVELAPTVHGMTRCGAHLPLPPVSTMTLWLDLSTQIRYLVELLLALALFTARS